MGNDRHTLRSGACRLAAGVCALLAAAACAKKIGEDSLTTIIHTGDRAHLSVVRFLPGAGRLATAAGDGVIQVWDLTTGRQTDTLAGETWASTEIQSLGVGPDARFLLAGFDDGMLALWDLPARTIVKRWPGHSKSVHGAEISPDGAIAATGSDDGTVRLWRLPDGGPLGTLSGHHSWVGRVKFSPDGWRLLAGGADGTLRVWDVRTGEAVQVLRGHTAWVRSGVFLAGSARVLSGGYDLELREWDVGTGATLKTMRGPRGMIFEVAASSDDRWGIAVDSNSTVSLYDLAAGRRVHAYATPWRPRTTTSCGDISPDGNWAAAGDWDDNVYVWDLRPAREAWVNAGGAR